MHDDVPTAAIVLTTTESEAQAQAIARALVERRLAACVQIDGPVTSWYPWNNQIEQAREYRLMIKTTQSAAAELQQELFKLHPYDEPEILVVTVDAGSSGYLRWLGDWVDS